MDSSAGHLTIGIERDPQTVLTLAGELDLDSAPDLWAALDEAMSERPTLILDLTGLEFIDSTGLGVLARAARECEAARGRITLRGPNKRTRELLELTRLDELFDIDVPAGDLD